MTPFDEQIAPPDLDAALLHAHALGRADALVQLYSDAGLSALAAGQIDAGCFFLTHARIYALESADPREPELHATLVRLGREI